MGLANIQTSRLWKELHRKRNSFFVEWVYELADATKNQRLSRWVKEIRGFDNTVQDMKVFSNAVADALSWNPIDRKPDPKENYIDVIIPVGRVTRKLAILQEYV